MPALVAAVLHESSLARGGVRKQMDLASVASDGGQFVAVGGEGTILTSPNRIRWQERISRTTAFLSGFSWNVDLLVAVDSDGTILTGPEG